jgi:hypothetical protein
LGHAHSWAPSPLGLNRRRACRLHHHTHPPPHLRIHSREETRQLVQPSIHCSSRPVVPSLFLQNLRPAHVHSMATQPSPGPIARPPRILRDCCSFLLRNLRLNTTPKNRPPRLAGSAPSSPPSTIPPNRHPPLGPLSSHRVVCFKFTAGHRPPRLPALHAIPRKWQMQAVFTHLLDIATSSPATASVASCLSRRSFWNP